MEMIGGDWVCLQLSILWYPGLESIQNSVIVTVLQNSKSTDKEGNPDSISPKFWNTLLCDVPFRFCASHMCNN